MSSDCWLFLQIISGISDIEPKTNFFLSFLSTTLLYLPMILMFYSSNDKKCLKTESSSTQWSSDSFETLDRAAKFIGSMSLNHNYTNTLHFCRSYANEICGHCPKKLPQNIYVLEQESAAADANRVVDKYKNRWTYRREWPFPTNGLNSVS